MPLTGVTDILGLETLLAEDNEYDNSDSDYTGGPAAAEYEVVDQYENLSLPESLPEAQPLVLSSSYLTRNDDHVMQALDNATYFNDHLPEFFVMGFFAFLLTVGIIMTINNRKKPRSDEYSVEQQQNLNGAGPAGVNEQQSPKSYHDEPIIKREL